MSNQGSGPRFIYNWQESESVTHKRCSEIATEVFTAASDIVSGSQPLNEVYAVAYSEQMESFEIYHTKDFESDAPSADIDRVYLTESTEDFQIEATGGYTALTIALILTFSQEPGVELEAVCTGMPKDALYFGYQIAKRLRPQLPRPEWVPWSLDPAGSQISRPDFLDFRG